MYSHHHHQRRLFALALLGSLLSLSHAQQVAVRSSKEILAPEDKSVTLNCISFGLQADPYNVVVFTAKDRTIYNSSDSSQKISDVTVVNHTAIDYYAVASGVSDVRCRINNTVSQTGTTIPAINSVTLSHDAYNGPNNVTLIRCHYSILPNVSTLELGLQMNRTEVGRFVVNAYQPLSFILPTTLPSLSVTNDSSLVFRIQPTEDFGSGKFRCVLAVTIGSSSLSVASPEWDTSASLGLMPSFVLAISALSVFFTFYY